MLDKNSVFVITGAAGSIVSAITADLAAASGGTFYLLDVVPEPDPDNPDLKRFVTDKEDSETRSVRAYSDARRTCHSSSRRKRTRRVSNVRRLRSAQSMPCALLAALHTISASI